jgi:DNA-directed RNA polymerase subunit RPC12/RpoP
MRIPEEPRAGVPHAGIYEGRRATGVPTLIDQKTPNTNNNMSNYYCKNCGTKNTSLQSLTGSSCVRHPLGANKGKHELYEGGEKPKYQCKYCGTSNSSLSSLTGSSCVRHPSGANKGKHSPAL